MKKTLAVILSLMLAAGVFAACGIKTNTDGENEIQNNETQNQDASAYTLQGIVDSIYAQKAPLFMFGTMPIDLEDEFSYNTYLGLDDPSVIAEAVVSESMIGAQAYSLVVARVAEGQDAAKVAEDMQAGIDPRKWVCVEADDVKVTTYGDLVCFIMISSEYKDTITADDVINAFTKIMNGEAKYEEGAMPNIPEMPEENFEEDMEESEEVDMTEGELEDEVIHLPNIEVDNEPAAMPEEDNTPAVAPEVTPEVTPEVAPEEAPEVTPEVAPEEEGVETEEEFEDDFVMPEPSELEIIVNKIYENKMPQFMLGTIPVDLTDEFSYKTYLGLDDPSVIAEAVVSESMIGAQAYSLVVARVADGQDAAKVAEDMKAGIDPRKWICVEADDIKTAVSGSYVLFCMIDSEYAEDFTAQDAVDGFLAAVAK